ncbi:uncharacterized protein LOC131678355 [Topomyia yanbarensis]|uniref:uncharacterized protein LOC131678355 n=1 Tax=Topomyia yanbarensis TaxID=2498891 RepID=UPI00273B8CB3|nr:uncharacterized protein LOC131678355 [Topomyia yanbarensis]
MNTASSFWGTFDMLMGREARKKGGQDALKVAHWVTAYAGVRKLPESAPGDGSSSTVGGFHSTGSDGFTGLSNATGGTGFPSIFHQQSAAGDANQLIVPVPGQNKTSTGRGAKARAKKLRLVKQPSSKQLNDGEVLPEEYMGPRIEYTVNLPRVTAQLEKLMGTNVVRLTDRKYMQDLQRRIQEDYNVTLEKRIHEREAKELDRERSLILSGAGDAIPEDFNSSVFNVNKKTNLQVCSRREKLKTIREKNAERLIKQGLRWERERLQMEDYNRQQEIERRSRREALLEKEKLYMIEDNERALNLLRLKTKKGPCRDMDLRALLMQQRMELGEKIHRRDFDMNEEKRMESDRSKERKQHHHKKKKKPKKAADAPEGQLSSPEEGYISMNQAECPSDMDASIMIKIEKDSKDSGDDSDLMDDISTADTGEGGAGGSEADDAETAEADAMKEEMNKVLEKKKLKVRNEDPKITRLKEADTVNDIYNIADEIIVLEKKRIKKGMALK